MTKAEIIAKTIRDMAQKYGPDEEYEAEVIIPTLNDRVPEGDSKTCENFTHLNVGCCETCHTFYAHYEMDVVELPDGGKAWICHAVKNALFPETKVDKNSTQTKTLNDILGEWEKAKQ